MYIEKLYPKTGHEYYLDFRRGNKFDVVQEGNSCANWSGRTETIAKTELDC